MSSSEPEARERDITLACGTGRVDWTVVEVEGDEDFLARTRVLRRGLTCLDMEEEASSEVVGWVLFRFEGMRGCSSVSLERLFDFEGEEEVGVVFGEAASVVLGWFLLRFGAGSDCSSESASLERLFDFAEEDEGEAAGEVLVVEEAGEDEEDDDEEDEDDECAASLAPPCGA